VASKSKEARDETPEAPAADASVQAFRDALEKSVSISRERMQEVVDDAVRRGRMTRADAEELVGRIITQVRDQAEELVGQVEPLFSNSPVAKAGRGVQSRARATARKARDRADEPLKSADRIRRKARLPGFPITAYDQLSVPQINNRLRELGPDDLQRVLEYEIANRNRVGVLRALERKLEQAAS
jgi:polyhydroxyalkanoate synthesis regulator phasin